MPALAPTLTLRHGAAMPRIGLGTWPMNDDQAEVAVAQALRMGWRLIDTAENYGNETGVGRGLRASGVPREEVFITSKFNRRWHSVEGARQAFEASCARLGVETIDLLLVHWPCPDQDRYVEAWQGLVALLREGRVRAIGTSNFLPEHLTRLIEATGVAPDVNQIQLAPWWPQAEARAFHAAHGIVTEAWGPVGRGEGLLTHPTVTALAAAHGRTPAQVVLRWHLEVGTVPIPKSADARRQAENLAVFDFSLSAAEVAALSALAGQGPALLDPLTFGH